MKCYAFLLLIIPLLISGCATLGFGEFEGQPQPAAQTTTTQECGVTFTIEAPDAETVYIAGDFNSWDSGADPMIKKGDLWTITLDLKPGTYQYKFVVNGSEWKPDPNNPNTAEDGFGGQKMCIRDRILSNGIYFYKLTADKKEIIKKMIMMR